MTGRSDRRRLVLASAAMIVDASSRLRSRTAGLAAMASGALTALYGVYGVAPPLLMLGVVTLLFAYAWGRHQRS